MVFWLSSQQKCHSLKVPFLCPQFLFPHVCLLSNHFHGSKESKCFQFKHAKIWKSWHNEMNFAPNKISALWRLNPSCNVVTFVSHILHAHDHAIRTLFVRNRVDIQLEQLKSGLNFAAAWCLRMLHWLLHDKKHWVLSKKFMGKAVRFSASRALLQIDHLQLLGTQTVKHAFQRMSKCGNLCSLELAQAVVEHNCQKNIILFQGPKPHNAKRKPTGFQLCSQRSTVQSSNMMSLVQDQNQTQSWFCLIRLDSFDDCLAHFINFVSLH